MNAMGMNARGKRRAFTEAALAAALAGRRARAARPKDPGREVDAFAVRHGSAAGLFSWEIRRHGGVVLARGTDAFPDAPAAQAAGLAALDGRRRGGPASGPVAGGAAWIS